MKAFFFNKIRDNRQNRGMKPSFQSFDKKTKKNTSFSHSFTHLKVFVGKKKIQAYFVSKINA